MEQHYEILCFHFNRFKNMHTTFVCVCVYVWGGGGGGSLINTTNNGPRHLHFPRPAGLRLCFLICTKF